MNVEFHRIKLGFTWCFLIKGKKGYTIFDTGPPGKGGILFSFLKKENIPYSNINYIILSHSHYDHTGNVWIIKEKTGAKVIGHKKELKYFTSGKTYIPEKKMLPNYLMKFFNNFTEMNFRPFHPDIIMDVESVEMKEYGIEGKIVETPGHTRGSISLVMGDFALVGDLCMNILWSRRGIPLFIDNTSQLMESWEKLIKMGVKIIYPAHGNSFPIEVLEKLLKEKKFNPSQWRYF